MPRSVLAAPIAALLVALLAGCGEPPVALDVPARGEAQHVLDLADVLEEDVSKQLELVSASSGLDVVALTFEDDRAGLGQADRGGRRLLAEWGADVVLVTVAGEGDFTSTDLDERVRFFGVFATDRFDVSRDLRERIIFDHVQAPAGENRWTQAYLSAISELEDEFRATSG